MGTHGADDGVATLEGRDHGGLVRQVQLDARGPGGELARVPHPRHRGEARVFLGQLGEGAGAGLARCARHEDFGGALGLDDRRARSERARPEREAAEGDLVGKGAVRRMRGRGVEDQSATME